MKDKLIELKERLDNVSNSYEWCDHALALGKILEDLIKTLIEKETK